MKVKEAVRNTRRLQKYTYRGGKEIKNRERKGGALYQSNREGWKGLPEPSGDRHKGGRKKPRQE